MSNDKEIIKRLFSIVNKQQKIITKMAQAADQSKDPEILRTSLSQDLQSKIEKIILDDGDCFLFWKKDRVTQEEADKLDFLVWDKFSELKKSGKITCGTLKVAPVDPNNPPKDRR